MTYYDFTKGEQPCNNYKPDDSHFEGSGNIHSCMYPFGSSQVPCCDDLLNGKVSSCQTCGKDHHSNGYETCLARQK